MMLTLINKKTNKELVASIGKIGIRFHLFRSHVFFINMLILSSLIEIDVCRKFIYIDPSHIKFLRIFPKYRSLAFNLEITLKR